MNQNITKIDSVGKITFIASIALLAISIIGGLFNKASFFEGYLAGFIFTLGIPLGSLAILLVHCLTHGAWGFTLRKEALAAVKTIPILAILGLPVLLGIDFLYMWADKELVANDHILHLKEPYLNKPFFLIRYVGYFVAWIFIVNLIERKSNELINDTSEDARTNLQLVSGLSMLGFVFTATFAAFDWVMSIEPHWFSTIFGIHSIIGHALSALTFIIVIISLARPKEDFSDKKLCDRLHELGNLSLALVMLWAYMGFSQYIIIWSGNLPEEIIWYLPRSKGSWGWFAAVLALVHFFVPFFLLLNKVIKRSIQFLTKVALLIFVMRLVDIIWNIYPTFHETVFSLSFVHITLPLSIFGIWFSFYLKKLRS